MAKIKQLVIEAEEQAREDARKGLDPDMGAEKFPEMVHEHYFDVYEEEKLVMDSEKSTEMNMMEQGHPIPGSFEQF